MRKLLPILLASALWLTGTGATNPPAAGLAYQQFKSPDRSKHVMVIRPSRWDVLGGALAGQRLTMFTEFGNLLDACEAQGLELHYYDTNFFESDKDHREMWTDAGRFYSLAIILWPSTSVASFSRYICADSTNVQLLVVGGSNGGAQLSWSITNGDTLNCRGFIDTAPTSFEAITINNGACLVTWDNVDTIWAQRWATGKRKGVLPSGMASVVRPWRVTALWPATGHKTFAINSAETLNVNLPPDPQDSIAVSGEFLGPVWKTRFTSYSGDSLNDNNGAGVGTWINSLATSTNRGANQGGLSPRDVWWVKFVDSGTNTIVYPTLVWALICRFTTAKPIKWGYDWDDVTDKFTDNLGQPPRWRNTAADSSLKALAVFGVKPSNHINPGHIEAYIKGLTPNYEVAWSGTPHTYLQSLTWIHHSHDSASATIGSNLVGQFGGYGTGNGSARTQGGVNVQIYNHRYASRYDPSSNGQPGSAGFGAGGRYGIIQRLAYMDSLRRVLSPNSYTPPYMGFPANQMMPVGWITRATTSNPLWTTYKVEALECPMDSLWWAFDSMLVKGNGRDGRKLYLRFLTDNPRGNNNLGGGFNGYALGTTTQYDRDSVVAASPFLYPNEKVTLPVSGRLVQAVGIGGWLMGLSPRNQYVNDCQYKMAALFGFKQIALYRSENSNATVGEAFNTDVWNVYGSPTGAGSGSINHDALGFRQSSRVIWQHPGQFTLIPCRTGDYHVEVMVLGMLQPIRGLEKSLAGRPIQRCVPAWTINDPY